LKDKVQPTVLFKNIQPIPHNNLQQAKAQPGNTQELIQEPQLNTVSCEPVTTKVAGRIQHFSQAWKQMTSDRVILDMVKGWHITFTHNQSISTAVKAPSVN